jgi:hypothetical protein
MRTGAEFSRKPLLDDVLDCLSLAQDRKGVEMEEALRKAELNLIALRDRMIDQSRKDQATRELKHDLDRVNTVLSVLTGIEYPIEGVVRGKIDEAKKALGTLLSGQGG